MSPHKFDVIIIGSGQAGTPLAVAFAKAGHKTALVEREYLGGCCVNVGCTPTKTMIASGRVAYFGEKGERVWRGVQGGWKRSDSRFWAWKLLTCQLGKME